MDPSRSFRWSLFFLALVGSQGCARAKVSHLPQGVVRITCEKGMKVCVTRAEKICEDKGYVVVGGQSRTHLLGGASSSYRQLAEVGELEVVCGDVAPAENRKPLFSLGGGRDETPAAEDVAPELRASGACTPGITQQCVGAGACAGGQVCLADGSGFGPCDCGPAAAAPAQPAPGQPAPGPDGADGPAPGKPPTAAPTVPNSAPEPTPLVDSAGSPSTPSSTAPAKAGTPAR